MAVRRAWIWRWRRVQRSERRRREVSGAIHSSWQTHRLATRCSVAWRGGQVDGQGQPARSWAWAGWQGSLRGVRRLPYRQEKVRKLVLSAGGRRLARLARLHARRPPPTPYHCPGLPGITYSTLFHLSFAWLAATRFLLRCCSFVLSRLSPVPGLGPFAACLHVAVLCCLLRRRPLVIPNPTPLPLSHCARPYHQHQSYSGHETPRPYNTFRLLVDATSASPLYSPPAL